MKILLMYENTKAQGRVTLINTNKICELEKYMVKRFT